MLKDRALARPAAKSIVIFGFNARDKEVNATGAFKAIVFAPLITLNCLAFFVFGLAVVQGNGFTAPNYFQYLARLMGLRYSAYSQETVSNFDMGTIGDDISLSIPDLEQILVGLLEPSVSAHLTNV